MVSLDIRNRSCNPLPDPLERICVLDKREDVNLQCF